MDKKQQMSHWHDEKKHLIKICSREQRANQEKKQKGTLPFVWEGHHPLLAARSLITSIRL